MIQLMPAHSQVSPSSEGGSSEPPNRMMRPLAGLKAMVEWLRLTGFPIEERWAQTVCAAVVDGSSAVNRTVVRMPAGMAESVRRRIARLGEGFRDRPAPYLFLNGAGVLDCHQIATAFPVEGNCAGE